MRVRSILITLIAWPALTSGQVTVIKAGKLLDPATGTMSANQVVVIEGSTIKSVGTDASTPADATVIDLSQSTLLPGLVDVHTHLFIWTPPVSQQNAGEARVTNVFFNSLVNTNAYRTARALAHAREMLHSGFTTVRDLGTSAGYAGSDLRRALDDGLIYGPTVLNAGRLIAPYGGAAHLEMMRFAVSAGGPLAPEGLDVARVSPLDIQWERSDLESGDQILAETRDELRKAVRENFHFGARVIKVVVDDQPHAYSREELAFVVEEASRVNLKVAAHCRTRTGAYNAAAARVASIEHGSDMSHEALLLAKKTGVVLVPTPMPETMLCETGRPDPHRHRTQVIDLIRRAHQAGVTMAFGSDVGVSLPQETRGTLAIRGIDSFLEAGIPALAMLQILTIHGAELLGVSEVRGRIKPGYVADLIATNGDPLENALAIKNVTFVMKNGKVVRHGERPRWPIQPVGQ